MCQPLVKGAGGEMKDQELLLSDAHMCAIRPLVVAHTLLHRRQGTGSGHWVHASAVGEGKALGDS